MDFKVSIWAGLLYAIQGFLTQEHRHLALCTGTIARKYFFPGKPSFVISKDDYYELLDLLLKIINELNEISLHIYDFGITEVEPPVKDVGSYIFLAKSCENVVSVLEMASWNTKAQYVIMLTSNTSSTHMEAQCIAHKLWNGIEIANAVIVISSEIYTYFPYHSIEYCGHSIEATLIEKWTDENGGKFVYNKNLFPDKIPKHFHGCPINVSVGNNSTEEHNIAQSIFKSLNFEVTYISEGPEVTDRYERIRMAMQYLVFGNSEIAIGGIPLVKDLTLFAEHVFPYFDLEYKWYVPCGKQLSRIDTPSRIFATNVYVALIGIIVLVNFILEFLTKMSKEKSSNVFTILYNIWAISLGVSITKFPRSYKLRILLFSWICFSFALNVVFQTVFTSYLVDPGMERQISDLEELLESGMRFGYREVEDTFYKYSSFRIHKQISKKRENCERSHCIQEIVDTGKFATLGEVQAVENYISFNGVNHLVCVMNDFDTFVIKPVAYGRKGSVILAALDRMFVLYVESGICNMKYSERNFKQKEMRREEFLVFQIKHLVIAFCALLLGYIISLSVFICELCYHRYLTSNYNNIVQCTL